MLYNLKAFLLPLGKEYSYYGISALSAPGVLAVLT